MDTTIQTVLSEVFEELREVNLSNKQHLKLSYELAARVREVEKTLLQKQSNNEAVINTKPVEQMIGSGFANMQTMIGTRLATQHVTHQHHLHKGILLSILFFITTAICLWQWINTYQSKKQYQANDIKYRSLKLTGNISLIQLLYRTDSLYNLSKDSFELQAPAKNSVWLNRLSCFFLPVKKKKKLKS